MLDDQKILADMEDAIERNDLRDMVRLLRQYDGKSPITLRQYKIEYGEDSTRAEWRAAIVEECESLIEGIKHGRD